MKKTTFLKALALSAFFTVGLATTAQRTDGFFNNNDALYADRDDDTPVPITGNGVTNQQFGAPLGSGLLIMVAAGAGYAISRRRRSKKSNLSHSSYILLAFALLLGLTQCKKKVETIAQANQGVFITLNIANDAKHEVVTTGNPYPYGSLGEVHFEEDDVIFVNSNNVPVGMLTYDGEKFSGKIGAGTPMSMGNPTPGKLIFCFAGNLDIDGETMCMDISNQKNNLPVMSFGTSKESYPSETNEYTCFLENKCALVKFTLPEGGDYDDVEVRLGNMLSEVTFSISPAGIFPTGKRWPIILNQPEDGPSNERWAILMPQDLEASMTVGVVVGNTAYANAATIPAEISNNGLYEVEVTLNPSYATDCGPYFSIGNGRRVYFSQGNLQYKAAGDSIGYRFAKHQWNFVGGTYNDTTWGNVYTKIGDSTVQCQNNNIASNYEGWIDLFGWGTGNMPYKTSIFNSDYSTFYDWGGYIGDGKWFTLDKDEWSYMINIQKDNHPERENKTAPATVNGVKGVVILPDVWELPSGYSFTAPSEVVQGIGGYIPQMNEFTMNEYTIVQWAAMEAAGAVFLPAAGHWGKWERNNNEDVYHNRYYMNSPKMYRGYWTPNSNSVNASWTLYGETRLKIENYGKSERMSVRLVRDVIF